MAEKKNYASPTTYSTTHQHPDKVYSKEKKRRKERHQVIPTLLELFSPKTTKHYTPLLLQHNPNLNTPLNDSYF